MNRYTESLQHFGIFGMHWGIRRYQNPDGTLTEEGKRRYSERKSDIESAKEYAEAEITKDKESRVFYQQEADKIRNIPATKKDIQKVFGFDDEDYRHYMDEYGSPKKFLEAEAKEQEHHAQIHTNRIKDWNNKIDELGKIKVDAISSDGEHMRQIEDIFSQAKGWFFRSIELANLRNHINGMRSLNKAYENASKQADYKTFTKPRETANINKTIADYRKEHPNTVLTDREILLNRYGYVPKSYLAPKKANLTERFNNALKDNPKLTYNQIYKEMKVDMNSEDQDVYKEAEDKWFKKHGY